MKRFHNWIVRASKLDVNQFQTRCRTMVIAFKPGIIYISDLITSMKLKFCLGQMDINLMAAWRL
jgi:hypothetical protein